MKQKQLLGENLSQTRTIREAMKPNILKQVTQDVYKSTFEISLRFCPF